MHSRQQGRALLGTPRVAIQGVIDVLTQHALLRADHAARKGAQLLDAVGVAAPRVHAVEHCYLTIHLQQAAVMSSNLQLFSDPFSNDNDSNESRVCLDCHICVL